MLRMPLGNFLTYFLTAWFIAAFALITFSGVFFVGTLVYHLIF